MQGILPPQFFDSGLMCQSRETLEIRQVGFVVHRADHLPT